MIYALLITAVVFAVSCGKSDRPTESTAVHDHKNETTIQAEAASGDYDHESDASENLFGSHTAESSQAVEPDSHDHEGETVGEEVEHDHETGGSYAAAGETWESMIGLETAVAERRTMNQSISAPGRLVPDPDGVAVVSPFIESSVNSVFVTLGDQVKKGDLLVCLTSPEIGMLRAEYGKSEAELAIAKSNFARIEKLHTEKIVPDRSLQEAESALKVAEVDFEYAGKKLLALGINKSEIEHPPTGHSDAVGSTVHIHAPITGVITSRAASIGQKVGVSDRLFEIVDLSKLWLEADVFEKDVSMVKKGGAVRIEVSACPGEYFTGTIRFVGGTVDPDTRTVKVVATIANKDRKLKPGMFARTSILVGEKTAVVVVPKEAVLEDESLAVVFVKESEGYHRHVVKTGIAESGWVEITKGLNEGDVVVTKGAYQLKSKTKMSGIDPHAGHNH